MQNVQLASGQSGVTGSIYNIKIIVEHHKWVRVNRQLGRGRRD